MKGIFITLEGNEGCGKSTQIKLLAAYLRKKGRKVFVTREPGGTAIGEQIRGVLLSTRNKGMLPVCETLLYMASRAQLVGEVILPRLKKGQIVICDRWVDSTVAYQGYAGGVDVDWINTVAFVATQELEPNLNLYLDLPVREGMKRALKRHKADRIEKKGLVYHEKVRQGFLKIAKKEAWRFKRMPLKASESVQDVHERIKTEVDRVLRRS